MAKTIQITPANSTLPDGLSESQILLHCGLPVECALTMPEVHSYVIRLAISAVEIVENEIGYDLIKRSYVTEFDTNETTEVMLRHKVNPSSLVVKTSIGQILPATAYTLNSDFSILTMTSDKRDVMSAYYETISQKIPNGISGIILALVSSQYMQRSSIPTLTPEARYYLSGFKLPRSLQ